MAEQQAFLWVLSEPGSEVTEAAFHDWYDNEHVPLRMGKLHEFLTGARYRAIDGQKPGWSASYEVSDPALFGQSKYTHLRANRSPREAKVVANLETLDRRTYTSRLFDTAGHEPPRGATNAAPIVVTVMSSSEPSAEEREAWRNVSGWRRSHAYKLEDSLRTGHGKEPVQNAASPYVAVHEFSRPDAIEASEAHKSAASSADELRLWKLYRAWDNEA